MKKVNDVQKKKLDLKKRTIMKLNADMMVRLNGGVQTHSETCPPPTVSCRVCDSVEVCRPSIITC